MFSGIKSSVVTMHKCEDMLEHCAQFFFVRIHLHSIAKVIWNRMRSVISQLILLSWKEVLLVKKSKVTWLLKSASHSHTYFSYSVL